MTNPLHRWRSGVSGRSDLSKGTPCQAVLELRSEFMSDVHAPQGHSNCRSVDTGLPAGQARSVVRGGASWAKVTGAISV